MGFDPAGLRGRDSGRAAAASSFDFFNYAGLHRTVWLYSTPLSYVADVSVVTGLDGPRGTVSYDVDAVDAQDLAVKVTLRDAEGAEVAAAEGDTGELAVADVRPWRPGEGYLYQLAVELWGRDTRPVDSCVISGAFQ